MSITYAQAADLLIENYGDWAHDDPDWWDAMIDMLMEYPSVKALRRAQRADPGLWAAEWRIPRWWPGHRNARGCATWRPCGTIDGSG